MSTKRRIAEKALAPIVAAGAGAAANYVAKKGPGFVEDTVLPRLKGAVQGAGGGAEKLPEKARNVMSGGGELAEQLTEKARGVVGNSGSGESAVGGNGGGTVSTEELSQRREQRAKSRAKRRKATRK